jgi:hypothetical protein
VKTIITIENNKITIEADDGNDPVEIVGGEDKYDPVQLDQVLPSRDDLEPDYPQKIVPQPGKMTKIPLKKVASIEKVCEGCQNTFTSSGAGMHKRKFCEDCKANGVKVTKGPIIKIPSQAESDAAGPNADQPPGKWWCIHCKAWVDHKTPECPTLNNTKDDLSFCKHCQKWGDHSTDQHPDIPHTDENGEFVDRWNCGMCRDRKIICEFHLKMEKGGAKPPLKFN